MIISGDCHVPKKQGVFLCLADRQNEAGGYTIQSRAPAFEAYVRLVKNPA